MPKNSLRQRKIEGRVMHEFAHGELKRGGIRSAIPPYGLGGTVRD